MDSFFDTNSTPLAVGEPLHQLQQVPGVAGESADGFHHDGVALPDELHHADQFRAFCVLAAGLVDEEDLHAQGLQQNLLPT